MWGVIKQVCLENNISKKNWKWNNDNSFKIYVGETYRTPDFYNLKEKKVIELFGRTYHDPNRAICYGRYVKPGRDEPTTRYVYELVDWYPEVIWSDTNYLEAKALLEKTICPKGLKTNYDNLLVHENRKIEMPAMRAYVDSTNQQSTSMPQ